jgi:tetratricopeptide (TPR) repeat protein
MMNRNRLPSLPRFILLIALLTGCGSQLATGTSTIANLREQAAAAPHDAALQSKLALAEMFSYEGDPAQSDAAMARARALDPKSPRLLLMQGLALDVHGHPGKALDAYLAALTLAPASNDALAGSLAELSVHAVAGLEGATSGYDAKVRAAFEPLLDDARLPTPARYGVGSVLIDMAYRRGDRDAAQAIAARLGCVTEARTAGPFGPRELLGFDRNFAAAPGKTLAASYDLGPGRGVTETRELGSKGCSMNIGGGPVARGGVSFVQTYVESRGGAYVARVQIPSTAEVFVDGRSLVRVDRRRALYPDAVFVPFELPAGRHEVTVKLATRHPNPALSLAIAPQRAGDAQALSLPLSAAATSGFARYLRGTLALARGDILSARESLGDVRADRPASALLLAQRATLALLDPLVPQDRRENTAQRLLSATMKRDPNAWSPAVQLADMMAGNGRAKEAIAAMREAVTRWPEVPTIALSLSSLLRKQDWDAEADAVIAKVRKLVPDACAPLSAELEALRLRQREQAAAQTAEALMRCEAQANARFSLLLRQRKWADAERELSRLQALEPKQNVYAWLLSRLELAKNRGDGAAADKLIAEVRARYPHSATAVLEQIDRLAGQGETAQALTTLKAAVAKDPANMSELHGLAAALGGKHIMDAYRRDGAEAVRRFEASGRSYEGPQVLVFDYMAARVFEDGSSVELVQTVQKAQSHEAVEELAEVHLPEGAELLKLQVIKPNGDRLEADQIEGKDDGVSLPTVVPGDYVETEYLQYNEPSEAFPTGYAGERFYFTSFEIPFDHSEMVVVVPKSLKVVNDPRGPAPQLEERADGDLRVLTYKIDQSQPLKVEPDAVAAREYLPSVRIGANAGWAPFVESIGDVLVDRDLYDPELALLAKHIVGDAAPSDHRLRAQRLYDWVLQNIENNDDVFSQAALMLRARTGNRARVLHYLMELAGVPTEMALVRSVTSDSTPSDMADTDTYEHLLLKFEDKSGPVWLFTVERYAPFGYVPPLLLGQPALLIERGGERVMTPAVKPGAEQRKLVFDIRMQKDGGAHVDAVETVYGSGAVSWRGELESVPDAELEQRFEAEYVARLFPGAQLAAVNIDDRTARKDSLALSYSFDVATLGRQVSAGWALPAMLPARLAANYAQLARRSTAELIPSPLEMNVVLRIHLPEGASRPQLAAPVELEAKVPGRPRFSMRSKIEDGVVVLERKLELPQMRVTPADYAELAAFCQRVDVAEAKELLVKLQ